MADNIIIYHGNCMDGFCAAYLADRGLRAKGLDVELYAATYGVVPDPGVVDGKNVYMLDFCYSLSIMTGIVKRAKNVLVLDHHKTSLPVLEELKSLVGLGLRWVHDIEKSGATLTAKHFGIPSRLAEYVEDRDLWRFNLEHSKAVNAWIGTQPKTLDSYGQLELELAGNPSQVVVKGKAVLAKLDSYVSAMLREARHGAVSFGKAYRVLHVNAPYVDCSSVVGALAEADNIDFAIGYFKRADGKWQYSLRSRPYGVDVSEIAKHFGGGGHEHAAGFVADEPFGKLEGTADGF